MNEKEEERGMTASVLDNRRFHPDHQDARNPEKEDGNGV